MRSIAIRALPSGATLSRSEQRYSQNGLADEFAQNVARRRHNSARMGIAEQSLTCRRLALEHAQHGGIAGALKVIDEIVDARRKPVSLDLHRRKLRAKRRQALSKGLAQMLEASPAEMRRGPGHRGPAKTKCDR